MNPLFNAIRHFAPWQQAIAALQKGDCPALYDMSESQRAFFACALQESLNRPILYVAPGMQAAMRAAEDCAELTGGKAAVLPAGDIQFVQGTASRDSEWQRMAVFKKLRAGEIRVLCVSAEALMQRFPLSFKGDDQIALSLGQRLEPQALIGQLIDWGYERVDMVEGKGQCALRGDILDVFCPTADQALRIEFFDEEIDALRPFDTVDQRSEGTLSSYIIGPASEYLVPPKERQKASGAMIAFIQKAMRRAGGQKDTFTLAEEDERAQIGLMPGLHRMLDAAERLKEEGSMAGIALWYPLLFPENVAPIEQLLPDPVVVLDTPERVLVRCNERHQGFLEELQQAITSEEAVPEQVSLSFSADEVTERLKALPLITMQDLLRGMGGLRADPVIQLKGLSGTKYQGRFSELAADIRSLTKDGYQIALLAHPGARSERIQKALAAFDCVVPRWDEQTKKPQGKALLYPFTLSRGFILDDAKLMVLTGSDLFGAGRKKTKARSNAGERIESFVDLAPGDYVVHEQHGIGIYQGTVRLQSEGAWRDYVLIQYKGTDKLYIPTDQFDRVQKYIGGQGEAPALNDLSSGTWEKQKSRVRLSLKKLAFDLVKLYAKRQSIPGHAFPPASQWEDQFDENFEFELTPDQESAVQDVLHDMERPINMDRLLCGDVGYGKTEVAMRAAFRAVMGGKQTAVLAPTTILAQQHYHTFKRRFRGFPVEIGVVSRFRSAQENKNTLSKLREGKLDILIGTHRLLSKDVRFKDLGLLIVDEEQRFGVGHKEIIKNMKQAVDVLTLSATPIPRTLHMSMVGVRDMSLLETPPEERFPVQTYVVDYNDGVIRDAIMRELNRGGQVFFLYNRVQQIDVFASRLRALVPEAKIAIAHGQMRENALEDVMSDFARRRFDVLLCTTIIENGIDIPLANTLIVFDADRFGLSQLYQLRGRVGRSNRAAYAYFMVMGNKALSETAEKRLAAIKEFTEFGAGFRIAMRDLEIRGAGNIFGPEQSGQVSVIGYDLYCKLIEEAVREAQGDFSLRERDKDTRVELHVSAFLPEDYVRGQAQRIEIYKRISFIRSKEDRAQLLDDLVDRFGEPPEEVLRLMDIALLRAMAQKLGSDLVTFSQGIMTLRLNAAYVEDPAALVDALTRADKRLRLQSGRSSASLLLPLQDKTPEEALTEAIDVFEALLDAMATDEKNTSSDQK